MISAKRRGQDGDRRQIKRRVVRELEPTFGGEARQRSIAKQSLSGPTLRGDFCARGLVGLDSAFL